MRTKTFNRSLIPILFSFALAACNGSLTPPTPSATSQPSANPPTPTQPTATPIGTGLCANTLAPVKAGATWTYRNTGGPVSPSTFTTTITEVRPDGFSTSTKLADTGTAEQDWACKPEGLVALGTGPTGLALSLQGIKVDLTVSNVSGVTLPAKVEAGMQWPYGFDVDGSLSQGNLSATVKGNVSTASQANGTESVTVPAGTFDAMKVESVTTLSVTANYQGIPLPLTATLNTTFWFAPGVGWVKSVETGEFLATSLNSTTELESYTIP